MATWYPGAMSYWQWCQANSFMTDFRSQSNQIRNSINEQTRTVSDQTKMIVASNEQISMALETGFNRLSIINERGFSQVTSAIEEMHSDLNYNLGILIQRAEYQNKLLNNILHTLQTPFETQIKELYNNGCKFIRQENLEAAVDCFKESISLKMGKYFFLSYYQLGRLYISGKVENKNIIDPKIAMEYLIKANELGNGILKDNFDGNSSINIKPNLGQCYNGRVISIQPYGAFVEFMPGFQGLVHISELDTYPVKNIEDILEVGQEIFIKLLEIAPNGYKLSRKSALNEKINNNAKSIHPFSPIMADCKFFLSLSYYFQLTGKNDINEKELLDNAIKYCEEAVSLNPNLSQGFYHLAKYFSYKNESEKMLLNFGKAVEIYRDYSFKFEEENVFEKNKTQIIDFLVKLKEVKLKSVERELQKAKDYINILESKGIADFQNLESEYKQIKNQLKTAEKDFQTGTYFGIDDCRIKLEEL